MSAEDAPSPQERRQAALRRLQAAQLCLDNAFFGVAVSEVYYAMLDAVRAALSKRGRPVHTHGGARTHFFKDLVQAGPLSHRLHQKFVYAFKDRRKWHYDTIEPDQETVEEYFDAANSILDRIEV